MRDDTPPQSLKLYLLHNWTEIHLARLSQLALLKKVYTESVLIKN